MASRVEKAIIVVEDRDTMLARVDWSRTVTDSVAMAPSGEEFVVVREVRRPPAMRVAGQYAVTVYDAASGAIRRSFDDIAAWCVNGVSIDPLGHTLLLWMNNDELEVRDMATGRKFANRASRSRATFGPDGRLIVAREGYGATMHLLDPRTLGTIRTLENHLPVSWHQCTPGSRRLLVGQRYADGINLVTSWDVETGTREWSRCGPAGEAAVFSVDGRLALMKARWNAWALWDMEGGLVRCVVVTQYDSAQNSPVFGVDGTSLHRGMPDGPRLWPPAAADRPRSG